ncbi:MAG: anhydro-N-acetylmuramic acid kinase [Hyphomonadaceae bacterium TMED5]|nr:anhydro-N-acetylmuramic acid kinase [Ponticaulis sp.]OUY00789.1 MAG: anhydro-N-acetylmuramic acid kinase [Hyphomonadaceae bacterium TMED5]
MSGTSVDAVDAAIIRTDGVTVSEFGPVSERKFTANERAAIMKAVDAARAWAWNGDPPLSDFEPALAALNAAHKDAYDLAVAQCASYQKPEIAGVHGQTVLHRPPAGDKVGATLQILNAPELRDRLGVSLAYDFRSDDVAAGGQGAPLAPVYHQALARDFEPPVAVLNLGGVANLTYIDGDDIFGFDCGPANGPVDEWVVQHGFGTYDQDGSAARAGQVDEARLADWMSHPFFRQGYPKSLDRYDFNAGLAEGLGFQDGAATLTAFCAAGVASGISLFPKPIRKLIVCGGGRLNPVLMRELRTRCPMDVVTAEDEGWRGDSIEAEAFALLAVRHLRGLPLSFTGTTGVPEPMSGGKLIS